MSGGQDPLAYGRYYDGREDEREGQREGDRGLSDTARGFLSDGLKKFKDQYGTSHGGQGQQQQNYYSGSGTGPPQSYQSGSYNQQQQPPPQPPSNRPHKQDKLSSFLDKFEETVSGVGSQLAQKIGTTIDADAYAGYGSSSNANSRNRFGSFAPTRESNDVKWHVDGFTYFWAVSRALETARESIWILDCRSSKATSLHMLHTDCRCCRVALTRGISTTSSGQERTVPSRPYAASCCPTRRPSEHHRLQGGGRFSNLYVVKFYATWYI